MEAFWLGISSGFLMKTLGNRFLRKPMFYEPWKYPMYMGVGGLIGVYYDWYRRILLEYRCELEEVREYYKTKIT
jgi:hypothetical protein